jgi:hypothetical protein
MSGVRRPASAFALSVRVAATCAGPPHVSLGTMADLRLEELNATNIVAANNLSLKPGQEQFIAPVTYAA